MATQHLTQPGRPVPNAKPAAWDHYWSEAFQADDRRVLLIRELCQFFCSAEGWPLVTRARTWHGRVSLRLDWALVTSTCNSRDLGEAMRYSPAEALGCLGAAAYEALFVQHAARCRAEASHIECPAKVLVRLHNHQASFLPISTVGADQVGRLVTIRGTVTRATPVRPLLTSLQFVCAKCGSAQDVHFPDGRFLQPVSCGVDGCRSRTLAPNRAETTCVDWQRITLQGLPGDERGAQGRVPRPLDAELLEDLTESCRPGDVVTVTGLVKVINGEPSSGENYMHLN